LQLQSLRDRAAMAAVYAAAERSRLTADWNARSTSADGALVPDIDTINDRARAAVRDEWAGSSAVAAYRRHVVGTGIHCRANARDPNTGKPREAFNRAADALWRQWSRARWCDIERRKSFVEMQGLLVS